MQNVIVDVGSDGMRQLFYVFDDAIHKPDLTCEDEGAPFHQKWYKGDRQQDDAGDDDYGRERDDRQVGEDEVVGKLSEVMDGDGEGADLGGNGDREELEEVASDFGLGVV